MAARTADIDQGTPVHVAPLVRLLSLEIGVLNNILTGEDTSGTSVRCSTGYRVVTTELRVSFGDATVGDGMKALAVIGVHHAEGGTAEAQRLLQHRVEYRREVTGRGVDDAEHLGSRSLLI